MKSDLEKVSKALGKIEAGTYGTDDEGKEISEERLRAMPWADKAL
jgi:RNA polymerase-binding transcription factor DksA